MNTQGDAMLLWKFTRSSGCDLRVGVGVVVACVSRRYHSGRIIDSQLQNLVMLGWGDNNSNDAGLLRMLTVTLFLLDSCWMIFYIYLMIL